MTACFVRGCTAAVTGKCKSFGPGCEAHLARWAGSTARTITRLPLDPDSPGRAAHAKASFLRLVEDEEKIDIEKRKAREAAREKANTPIPTKET
ncbi:MAG: hypothetical protein KJ887_07270 [Candidatus Omnitrophica bacterium]|nr:hypothetical protein [Candidatus Omnitrophota bacterium]